MKTNQCSGRMFCGVLSAPPGFSLCWAATFTLTVGPSEEWAGGQGGVSSPGSALGAPVVSELELHISVCLPFKFSRCHLFLYMFFFKKAKQKIFKKE